MNQTVKLIRCNELIDHAIKNIALAGQLKIASNLVSTISDLVQVIGIYKAVSIHIEKL